MLSEELVYRYDRYELTLAGPREGNPYQDVSLRARCTLGSRTVQMDGFYDGGGSYRVRFMPDSEGTWELVTESNATELDGIRRHITCISAREGVHGPVRVRDTYHFAYDDGTPYYPFGTTCYAWIHQTRDLQERTLRTLARAPFNKLRMTVFPKHYIYNSNEPELYPFERSESGSNDYWKPNPGFFRLLEQRIDQLSRLGIEADVILFHPYDRWGYARMSHEQDLAYLRYAIARLSSSRNVWWSLANEYDFMLEWKTMPHWDALFQTIERHDPYSHLRSIHNGDLGSNYDHTKPWVTHACIQNPSVEQAPRWRRAYGKPVLDDECEYEGNIPMPWGNITGRELVHRFWVMAANGAYAGHGETYADAKEELWWSKGGELKGDSWRRIGFLREIMEQGPGPLTPLEREWVWTRVAGGACGDYRLLYFGPHQPVAWGFGLPSGVPFELDWIDTWDMTITPVAGAFCDVREIPMPGRAYMAARIRPLSTKPD